MSETGKPVIGLLGGPGSGKSYVAEVFSREGAAVIDADALSRQVMADPAVIEQLHRWWGDAILTRSGDVDRRAVSDRVFDAPEALQALEGLIHPRVQARRAALRTHYGHDAAVRAIVEDSPLLLESGLAEQCDVLVFVQASFETRARRLAEGRGWGREELARREKRQMPLDTKRKRADYIVQNDASDSGCIKTVRYVLSLLLHAQTR